VEFVIEMLRQGFARMGDDPYLHVLIVHTIQLAVYSTAIALVLGLPLAYLVGIGTSRARRAALIVANAGLGLPPVAVGVFLALSGTYLVAQLGASLGQTWQLYGTFQGLVVAQTILALPIVVALGATTIRSLPDGLVAQARVFGASRWRLALFVLREAKVGIVAAVIVAIGSAMAEVGAVTIIGGNDSVHTATLASQVLHDVSGVGGTPAAVEHVLVLLAMMLILGVLFTIVQQSGRWTQRLRERMAALPAGAGA
jgi:tungstate transport system permease protein